MNCIAIKGSSSMSAAMPQAAILQRLLSRLPSFAVCPVMALPPPVSEASTLASEALLSHGAWGVWIFPYRHGWRW